MRISAYILRHDDYQAPRHTCWAHCDRTASPAHPDDFGSFAVATHIDACSLCRIPIAMPNTNASEGLGILNDMGGTIGLYQ